MSDTETVKPADAALLRKLADGFDSGEYQHSGNDDAIFVIAARLRALADVLEQITPDMLFDLWQYYGEYAHDEAQAKGVEYFKTLNRLIDAEPP